MDFLNMLNPVAKWLHIIAGVMWIGLLYFFNFINAHFAATMDGDTKKKVVPELMPRTLYWFRWGAAWTWVTGIILMLAVFWISGDNFAPEDIDGNKFKHLAYLLPFLMVFPYDFLYNSSIGKNTRVATIISFAGIAAVLCILTCLCQMTEYRAYNIHIGAMFGSIMAFNVWGIIWPNQKKALGIVKTDADSKKKAARTAMLFSRTNTMLSIPMLYAMVSAQNIY